MKLLCDHMLGSLAKWLRIFGFDTIYPEATTDDESILKKVMQEGRLLLSRDKQLLQRAKSAHVCALEVQSTNLLEQLAEVLATVPLDAKNILTRCTLCNTPLLCVDKKDVQAHVPERVFQNRDDFWCCPLCQKYYWRGTHYANMRERIEKHLQRSL